MTDEEKDIILALRETAHTNTLVPNRDVIKLIWIIEKQQKEIEKKSLIIRFEKKLLDSYEKKIEKKDQEIEELNEEADRQYKLLCEIHNKNEEKIKDLKLQYILEIQKKDKQIDLMAGFIMGAEDYEGNKIYDFKNKEEVKQYFEKETGNGD